MSYTVKNGVLPNTPGKMDFVNVVFCLFVCLFVVFCCFLFLFIWKRRGLGTWLKWVVNIQIATVYLKSVSTLVS